MRHGSTIRILRTRKLAAGTAVLVLALVAAACGSSSSNSTGHSASSPQTLNIITWENPPAVAAIKTIDAEFEKTHPNIKVQLQTAADITGSYQTLLQTSVGANSADIVSWYPPLQPLPLNPTRSSESTWQFWSTHGVFANLNGSSWLSKLSSSSKAAETYKGSTYGLVTGSYQEGVFYNKAMFAKYNLTPPTTYDQFVTELNTLKSHGITPLYDGLGSVGATYMQFLYYPLMADVWAPKAPGAALATDLENGKVKWSSRDFTTVMQREKQLAGYLEPNYTGVPWEGMPGAFAKGDSAMLLDGSWDLSAIHQANPSMQVGFFPLPGSNTASDNKAWLSNNLTFSVLNKSPHKAAAEEWLNYFASPQVYSQYVSITGISPSFSGKYAGFTAQTMGQYFGKGVHGSSVFPILSPNDTYWDQPANWPTQQLNMVEGKTTPAQVEAAYQSGWKTS